MHIDVYVLGVNVNEQHVEWMAVRGYQPLKPLQHGMV